MSANRFIVYPQWVFLLLFCVAASAMADTENTLRLDDVNIRYDVNSAVQASGFYVCPEGLETTNQAELSNKKPILPNKKSTLQTTTLPNFKKNNRYCFFIQLQNRTDQSEWMLHFSNFFIDKVQVNLFDGSSNYTVQSVWIEGVDREDVNILGRAFSLQLEKDKPYLLTVELVADGIVSPPYIGLMSKGYYQTWSKWMSSLYNISIGIIIGLILVALLCSIILKDVTFFWFGVSSLLLFSFFAVRSHLGIFVLHSNPELPSWIWLWASATSLSLLLFARAFLLPAPSTDSLHQFFNICIGYFLLVALLSYFFSREVNLAIYSVNGLLMMGIIFYSGMARVINNGRYYLIFMLGWVPVLFSLLEHVAIAVFEPEAHTSTLSYKILREPVYQILHMLLHFIAMLIRIDTLKKDKYQAEMRNEAKSRFLASVSHDLQQPLHSMGMFLAHLETHVNSNIGKNILTKVFSLHTAMNDSFKTLMDLSRLEAGAVKVHKEEIDLGIFIARIRLEFEPQACAKGLKIRFKCNIKNLFADPELLERTLRNLLTNAIKYTERGGVLVGFRRRKNKVLIQVWDTGPGISEKDQRVIFTIYERSEKISNIQPGMGIGLATVKHLVDLLGGEIKVFSKEKISTEFRHKPARIGTLFQVSLPYLGGAAQNSNNNSDSIDKTTLQIMLELADTQLMTQVSGSLKNWGYLTSHESRHENPAPVTLIITQCNGPLTTEYISGQIQNFEDACGNVVIALFCDEVNPELAGELSALNVHILSTHYRPAQLRSLLRYLEIFLHKT
jgi:two-component system, sensor histidine kinase